MCGADPSARATAGSVTDSMARRLAIVLAGLVLSAACSATLDPPPAAAPTPVAEPTPTPVPNEPPTLATPGTIRVVLDLAGNSVRAELIVTARDADGEVVAIELQGAPDGLVRQSRAQWEWAPTGPGSWQATVVATDDDGATTSIDVDLVARYPQTMGLLGLGDSVASGHGLDRSDYFGGDRCWRAGVDAYPGLTYADLRASGIFAAESAFALVACSGADVEEVMTDPVGGGFAAARPLDGTNLSQLDWAIRSNPSVITLTVGANDLGFLEPQRLFTPEGELDQAALDAELNDLGAELGALFNTLVTSTDSIIVVTTYYDPSATVPQGFEGCQGECFGAGVARGVDGLAATIEAAAAAHTERILVADLRARFEGHGAPNGLGPDGLRENGFGPLGELIGLDFSGVQPYCARGETIGVSWISPVDCVHPDATGAAEIAAAVSTVVRDALGEPTS